MTNDQMPHKSTRRDFLTGKALARVSGEAAPGRGEGAAVGPRDTGAETCLIRATRSAMACDFEVALNAGQYEQGTEAALRALDLVDALEDELSYFRPDSQISRINRTAHLEPVALEPPLFELLELALRIHAETEGAWDITATPLWEAWGFARRAARPPTPEQLAEARAAVGSQWIELDPQRRTIFLKRPGVRLNLGSIGKGHALDRAAALLTEAGVGDFLFHAGQSSVAARGRPWVARDAAGGARPGWSVGIRHPLRPEEQLAEVLLEDCALGTSGSRFQFFRHRGRRFGHILDPRTGQPAEGVLQATVVAPSAAVADALSTAFYVMGPEKARDYCRTRPEIAALLVCPSSEGSAVEVITMGFPEKSLCLARGGPGRPAAS